MTAPQSVKKVKPSKQFSVCVLVNNLVEYQQMERSFRAGGFTGRDVEWLFVDNTQGNTFDAYSGLNALLTAAQGEYVLLCHQDLVLLQDNKTTLLNLLQELTRYDPHWALAGNAGGTKNGKLALRITDQNGADTRQGKFPVLVTTLDENFIVVRRAANVGLSCDLHGFHFYGTDLCLQAALRGYRSYVIDFHLQHNGRGTTGPAFYALKKKFIQKYKNAFKARVLQTTCTVLPISTSRLFNRLSHQRWFRKLYRVLSS